MIVLKVDMNIQNLLFHLRKQQKNPLADQIRFCHLLEFVPIRQPRDHPVDLDKSYLQVEYAHIQQAQPLNHSLPAELDKLSMEVFVSIPLRQDQVALLVK